MYSIDNLTSEIFEIASLGWQRLGKPVFLANLGGRLSKEAKTQLQLTGLPLKSFMEQYLSNRLRLISMGDTGDVVVPKGADTDRLTDEYLMGLHVKKPRLLSTRPPPIRYMAGVWKAFELPMSSQKRYIELRDGREAVCHNVDSETAAPPNSFEVVPEDLPPIDPYRNIASPPHIFRAIRVWAEKHQIDTARLREAPERSSTEGASPSSLSANAIASNNNAMERLRNFLEILEPDDLARISIPSEVLLHLLKR
jgi:hypothetical protein